MTYAWIVGAPVDYEVDFIDYFSRLVSSKMGAKFNANAYLIPIVIEIPKL